MKVVLDTNVLISAIMFGGKSRIILEMGVRGKIRIVISHDILKELSEVLIDKKFKLPKAFIQQTIHELLEITELVINTERVSVMKDDPDDNRILECALCAGAHCIISGDKHLLNLKHFRKIPIVSPNDFLQENTGTL